ncbi:MAG: hypothetical protein MJ198_03215 [Bacteroidales bacterium]|nr:hypothetical protein [Bacteroidales bacterium]
MKRIIKTFATVALLSSGFSLCAQENADTFCLQNQAIYQQRYKNENASKNFTPETFKAWRNLFFSCPTASKNMYVPHGVTMFTALYQKENDKAKKQQYLDTIMMIYDRRIENFGEESNYIGKKGADLFILDASQYEKAYEYCKKSIDAMGNNAEAKTMVICLQTAVKKFQNGTMEKAEVIALYQQITDICKYNIEKGNKNGQACEKQLPNIEQMFLSIKPDCNDMVALFEPQFNADPTNPEVLKKITDNLSKDCASSDLYFKAAIELDKIEPSAQSKRAIGDMYVAKKQVSKALDYYKESIDMEEDASKKANVYYKMAYNTSGATSVGYAHKALALNPNMGAAYLIIASKYVESINSCTSGAEFPELEKWKIYWVAYDMCQNAKAADASVASQANSYAASYKAHFPDAELLFGYNVTEGTKQTVGCWINMTTTAKVK